MQIFVRTRSGRNLTVDVEAADDVSELRKKVQREGLKVGERLPPARQRLVFANHLGDVYELRDGKTMAHYRIQLESQLVLAMRPAPRPVDLNVGGKPITTLLSTLLAVRGSKLCAMFEGLAQGGGAVAAPAEGTPGTGGTDADLIDLPVDSRGAFLLDRNGMAFEYIVDYLRDHKDKYAAAGLDDADGDDGQPEPDAGLDEAAELVQLRAQLSGLKLSAVKRRALAVGIDPQALLDADDAPDIKAAVIDLVVAVVGPKKISLPETQEALQRLVTEADYFGLPELAAAARERLLHTHRATEADRQELRTLLAQACQGTAPHLSDAQRTAAVTHVEQLCGGHFSLRTLREQDQRVADMAMLERLVGRAALAVQLEQEHGMSAKAAGTLAHDWTGRYCTLTTLSKLKLGITDAEVERLGLEPADVEALPKGTRFAFREVRNNGNNCSFDDGGVLNHIATEGGTTAWVNPHSAGRVVASRSSNGCGTAEDFVGGPGQAHFKKSYTNAVANSWMAVDLGATRTLVVEHYALRHSKGTGNELRHWELQGAPSLDGPWTTLRRHDGDLTIQRHATNVVAWPVEGVAAFRAFRIQQHGANNDMQHYLMCSGIEFWGVLVDA